MKSLVIAALIVTAATAALVAQEKPEKRALVVIDVQNVYFSGPLTCTYPAGSLENIAAAVDAATATGVPVVIVQHTSPRSKSFLKGSEAWNLHAAIADKPRAHYVEKNYPGSFTATDLESWLRANGVTTVVIAGYMTQMCCDTTSRQAMHLGFRVEFLSDATGTPGLDNAAGKISAEELHTAILAVQASGFSRVISTADWIASLK